ncbi:MAG: hypothetical protein KAY37_04170 [Phycisphaerae bacterium]|nr:hypothetical protein [Phycisphaerae bacterium]
MISSNSCRLLVTGLVLGLLTLSATAQWSSDPLVNLPVADRTGEQAQPKIASTSDGGCYLSWFDNSAGGYDVYLQRLDALGYEQWPHNGVLLADRSFSSTEDYGLDVDTAGNAVLAFRDDRSGSTLITAVMVAPDGTLLWGANGVQLSSGEEVYSPRIAGTSDGNVVVGWTQEHSVKLQKLDTLGMPLWGAGVVFTDTGGAYFSLSDLHGSDAGGVIASWVRWGPNFCDPKHVWAQKLSSTGHALWNSPGSHVIVFDGGSLQFGNYPPFITDGSGGAVFAWYGVSPLQCYAQRVLADGSEAFAHNGVPVSTDATRVRVSPSVSFNPATEETFLFWVEENAAQSQDGVYGQKLAIDGTRQWTDMGKVLVPVGLDQRYFVRNLQYGDGALVFFLESPSFGNDVVYGTRVDGNGDFPWPGDLILACSLPSEKGRLDAALSTAGYAILAWHDGRSDDGDVYAQNVNPDGTLGLPPICPGDSNCDGAISWRDIDYFVAAMNDNVAAWEAMFAPGTPSCLFANNDVNDDGAVSWRDIDPLVSLMNTTCP